MSLSSSASRRTARRAESAVSSRPSWVPQKRERQKANRAKRQAEEAKAARTSAVKRNALRWVIVAIAAVAAVVLIAWIGGAFDSDESDDAHHHGAARDVAARDDAPADDVPRRTAPHRGTRRTRPPLRNACRAPLVADDCVDSLPPMRFGPGRLVTLLAASCVVFAACGDDDDRQPVLDTSPTQPPTAQAPTTTDRHRRSPTVSLPAELPTELVITDLIEGTGEPAKEGDTVTVNYVGVRSEDGTEFDNSYDRGQPYTLTLGEGGVIQGWDEGLIGVKAGGRRQLDIPAALAYGDQGARRRDQARRRAVVRDRRRVDHARPACRRRWRRWPTPPSARLPTARRRSSRSSPSTRPPASTSRRRTPPRSRPTWAR